MVWAGQGPAAFTGLRVALVTARVLGFATGAPVHGVCSLDGLALAAASRVETGDDLLVATDARRREVYSARYRSLGPGLPPRRLTEPAVGAAAELVVDGARCLGRGAQLYPDALPPDPGLADLLDPDAADLGLVAEAELAAGVAARQPVALYLRRPDAVEKQSAGAGR